MSSPHVATSVRDYIRENFLYMHPDAALGDDQPLIGSGILDSLGVVELIAFIEESFDCHVNDHDVTEANFGTVSAIARLIEAKRINEAAA